MYYTILYSTLLNSPKQHEGAAERRASANELRRRRLRLASTRSCFAKGAPGLCWPLLLGCDGFMEGPGRRSTEASEPPSFNGPSSIFPRVPGSAWLSDYPKPLRIYAPPLFAFCFAELGPLCPRFNVFWHTWSAGIARPNAKSMLYADGWTLRGIPHIPPHPMTSHHIQQSSTELPRIHPIHAETLTKPL